MLANTDINVFFVTLYVQSIDSSMITYHIFGDRFHDIFSFYFDNQDGTL